VAATAFVQGTSATTSRSASRRHHDADHPALSADESDIDVVNIESEALHASDSQTLDDERQQLVKLSVVEKRDDRQWRSQARGTASRGTIPPR
jgi:hypothetical protein